MKYIVFTDLQVHELHFLIHTAVQAQGTNLDLRAAQDLVDLVRNAKSVAAVEKQNVTPITEPAVAV